MGLRILVSDFMGKHKLNNKDVSRATGIRETTVSHYYHETVKRMDKKHIEEFCKLFNCQPGDLLKYVPEENDKK